MAQQNDRRPTDALPLDALPNATPDHTLEKLSIFSAPALEVVFRWWAESNQRWTERNAAKAQPSLPSIAAMPVVGQPVGFSPRTTRVAHRINGASAGP